MNAFDVFASVNEVTKSLGSIRAQTLASDVFSSAQFDELRAEDESLCFVVLTRGDSNQLRRCLRSIPASCSVLVIDSGDAESLEGTELGRQVRSVRRSWTGNFAEARNFAREQLSGGWVMYVDDDEFLLPGHADRLVEATRILERHPQRDQLVGGVAVVDRTAGVTPFLPRLLRVGGALRWKGPIHEILVGTHDAPAIDVALDATIAHDGYESGHEERSQRNASIIDEWATDGESSGRMHLARAQELSSQASADARMEALTSALASGDLTNKEKLSAQLSLMVGLLLERGPFAVLTAVEQSPAFDFDLEVAEPGSLELTLLRARSFLLYVDTEFPNVRKSISKHLQAGAGDDPESDIDRRAVGMLVELTERMGEDATALKRLYGAEPTGQAR